MHFLQAQWSNWRSRRELRSFLVRVPFVCNGVDPETDGDAAKCRSENSGWCAVCVHPTLTPRQFVVCLLLSAPRQATTCPRPMGTVRKARVLAEPLAGLHRSDVTATSTTSLADIAEATLPNLHQVFLLQPGLMEAWATRRHRPPRCNSFCSTCPRWRSLAMNRRGGRSTSSNHSLAHQRATPPR